MTWESPAALGGSLQLGGTQLCLQVVITAQSLPASRAQGVFVAQAAGTGQAVVTGLKGPVACTHQSPKGRKQGLQ